MIYIRRSHWCRHVLRVAITGKDKSSTSSRKQGLIWTLLAVHLPAVRCHWMSHIGPLSQKFWKSNKFWKNKEIHTFCRPITQSLRYWQVCFLLFLLILLIEQNAIITPWISVSVFILDGEILFTSQYKHIIAMFSPNVSAVSTTTTYMSRICATLH